MESTTIALVVYDGVLDDECEAFRSVLGLVDGADIVTVGAAPGEYSGPGGVQVAELGFDSLSHADVVVVPGGLGCERAADDPALRRFLVRMETQARFVAASSTGTVVLASAGLLHGEAAATHWLATDLLRRYGSEATDRRMVVRGNVITCEGRISAVYAAFALVERMAGSAAAETIRATLIKRGQPLLREPSWRERLAGWFARRTSHPADDTEHDDRHDDRASEGSLPPVTPLSVMVELVDNDDLARHMKRSARRRRRTH